MRTIRDCNVAVFGGAGFLGSHLVNHLIDDRGCKVLVVDNLCAGRREFVHPSAEFIYADITKSEGFLQKLMASKKIKYAFNYAAHPYIPDSFARPAHVFEVNANGAIAVINAAQDAGVQGILQISSAEIYGEGGAYGSVAKMDEESEVIPHSTYGVAKAAVDSYVQTAWRERKTPCIALRQFNAVGERETHEYIVPEIISQLDKAICPECHRGMIEFGDDCRTCKGNYLLTDTPVVKLGNNSFRDFLYAGDQARIAVELLERGQWGEVYNLGSETGVKIYNLAKLIGKVMGFADVQVVEDEKRKRPWEIWNLLASNDKIKRAIHTWPTLVTLEEALRRTVADFENNGRKWCWQ